MRHDDWEPVTLGKGGAEVRRSLDSLHYAKRIARPAGHPATAELVAERDRLAWLATTPIAAPRVVDWEVTDRSVTLVTTTLPGIPASAVPTVRTDRATRSLAAFLRNLHALDPTGCPFDRSLSVAVELARANLTAGLVDEDDFDAARRGRTALAILTRSMCSARLNSGYGADRATDLFAAYGATAPDPKRIAPYRLLDEFF